MKVRKILFAICLILLTSGVARAQDSKTYYKDTLFEFVKFKVEIKRAVATDQVFKFSLIITNTSDQFIIISPSSLVAKLIGSEKEFVSVTKKQLVVAPKFSRAMIIKFAGVDFRKPALELNVKEMELTEKLEAVYEINDFDIFHEITKQNGPITWTLTKVVLDDKKSPNFRIDGNVKYSGDKFLGIFYNNIILKTNDGKTYINESKASSMFSFVRNKYYYDKTKPFEKQVLIFPVPSEKITEALQPKVSFNAVFNEYSLVRIEGFSIRLTQGTINDYLGSKANKEIEEIE
jgi:hypothetical protein